MPNIYSEKQAARYKEYIRFFFADEMVRLSDFCAGAFLGLLVGCLLGFLFGVGTAVFLGFKGTFFFAMLTAAGFGALCFVVFREAPGFAYRAAVRDIERNLLVALPYIKSAAASGVPLSEIFRQCIDVPFGYLSVVMRRIRENYEITKDFVHAITTSIKYVNSEFYARVMLHLAEILHKGVTYDESKPLEQQPLAVAVTSLAKDRIERFYRSCQSFKTMVQPFMQLIVTLCIIFPIMLQVLVIVSGFIQRPLLSEAALKVLVIYLFPLVSAMLLYFIIRGEPK